MKILNNALTAFITAFGFGVGFAFGCQLITIVSGHQMTLTLAIQ